jgi:hypothetical protein
MRKRKPEQREETIEAILEEVARPKARVHAYGRIIARVKLSFEDYVKQFPNAAANKDFEAWIDHIVIDIGDILEILDEYSIEYQNEEREEDVTGEERKRLH